MSKYVSLSNLARYDGRLQPLAQNACAIKNAPDAMWRQTERASSVSFWPVGNSPLEGTVDFMFTETSPASGTKSPDNPSTISGVSSIGLTVCQEEGVDEHSYTLSLGGAYYGGSIDLATGVMTVTWWGVVFTGEEENTWFSQGQTPSGINRYSANLANKAFLKSSLYSQHCTHFPYAGDWNSSSQTFYASNDCINFFSTKPTLEDFKAFVASQYASGTPVIAAYMLTNPKTVQLSPLSLRSLPQPDKYVPRINSVYSDADAVQIVYQKNPVRDKYEKVQAIIAQGGNV